jgi:hypothetical protein
VESSLGDFGARKYDPELGRFTSVDPLWEEMPGSSPFHYCFNNPIMMRDPFGLEPDGFKNQLTDLEWQCGGEQEEASPIKAASEYSERVKKETIRANKIAWNLQMRDRAAADKIHLTLDVAGIFDPTPCSDLTNAGLYVSEGNYLAAGISIVGVLPWIGDIFKSTRITAAMARLAERGAVKGGQTFFQGAKYSPKVLKQMSKGDDIYHAFPTSVDVFATKYGRWSSKVGADGKSYQWLEMGGSYGGRTGTFEYIKDANGTINHRYFRAR